MARVRACGGEFYAEPVEQLPNGDWIMRSLQHGNRVSPGTMVKVKAGEVLDQNAMPETDGMAQITAAMAKERETIPSVESILRPIQEAAKPARAAEADAVTGERAVPFPKK
jgi:hypothetical protein